MTRPGGIRQVFYFLLNADLNFLIIISIWKYRIDAGTPNKAIKGAE